MNQRIFWFFLVLLCHNRTAGESVQNPVAAEAVIRYERCSPNLEDRVFKLETKNSQQDKEISTLKTTVLLLKDRVVHLEAAAEAATADHVIYSPAKRPARLLPSHIFRKEKNITNNEDNERAFEGPPTSCATLAKIGYTLNGYYLIKGKDQQSKNIRPNKIQIVFCRFKQIKFPGDKLQQINFETLVGNVEVKSRSVHFYVQRNTSVAKMGILRYNLARLNVGRAMDLSTGIFTVPVNGVYHFQFTGVRDGHEDRAIYLEVNGDRVASSYSRIQLAVGHTFVTGAFHASFRLKKGDKVNIFKDQVNLLDNMFFYTHFTGWLVEEDLDLP